MAICQGCEVSFTDDCLCMNCDLTVAKIESWLRVECQFHEVNKHPEYADAYDTAANEVDGLAWVKQPINKDDL